MVTLKGLVCNSCRVWHRNSNIKRLHFTLPRLPMNNNHLCIEAGTCLSVFFLVILFNRVIVDPRHVYENYTPAMIVSDTIAHALRTHYCRSLTLVHGCWLSNFIEIIVQLDCLHWTSLKTWQRMMAADLELNIFLYVLLNS